MCKVFSGCLLEHLRKPGSLFPLHTPVSSASVYSNRGENNTGKILENMIVKLQMTTGGLRGGKSLHHFVFNGLYLSLKCCLLLPFKKEPIYRGRMKGCRVRASKDGLSISREYLWALRIHWSHLCSPATQALLSPGNVGTPPASRGVGVQPWDHLCSSPGAAQTPFPDMMFLGCSWPRSCWLPIPASHSAQTHSEVAKQRMAWAVLGRALMVPSSNKLPFGVRCVHGGWQGLCPQHHCAHPSHRQLCSAMGKMSSRVSC